MEWRCTECNFIVSNPDPSVRVFCQCTGVAVIGDVPYLREGADAVRVDDDGNRIELGASPDRASLDKLPAAELADILDKVLENWKGLHPEALREPVSGYELLSLLELLSPLLRALIESM